MTHGLASIFVNNQRVEDLDNPELTIRDIIEAYGRDPERCIVYRLESDEESQGDRVDLNERVDLAAIRGALYLRCESRRTEATAPSPPAVSAEVGDEEELMEFEQVPEYEDTLGGTHTAQKDEVPQGERLSPETGKAHSGGDPSGHQSHELEPEQRWNAEQAESIEPAQSKPSALGSEIFEEEAPKTPTPPRRSVGTGRARASTSASPATSTRTSPARRKNNKDEAGRRSAP